MKFYKVGCKPKFQFKQLQWSCLCGGSRYQNDSAGSLFIAVLHFNEYHISRISLMLREKTISLHFPLSNQPNTSHILRIHTHTLIFTYIYIDRCKGVYMSYTCICIHCARTRAHTHTRVDSIYICACVYEHPKNPIQRPRNPGMGTAAQVIAIGEAHQPPSRLDLCAVCKNIGICKHV